ncbi:formate/nitrite transporter family protein [Adlercreutzia sp. ZJ141]|uniref:formate/nitrite transporter family protein n=1 Tax=Adlercreutzia sp. ZJ141 TaxID=2709406 RepID=UPI001F14D08D|nr:formate/nitrite transporter family protein [Adlercreutzia sp. ZJ141]
MTIEKEDVLAANPDCVSGAALLQKAQGIAVGKASTAGTAPLRCFALSVLAGVFIAFGGTFMLLVKGDAELGFAASQLLGGFVFSVGLVCVIIAGAELFTGNNLMVAAVADKKVSWGAMLKNWGIVYVGNLVGSLLVVVILLFANFAGMNGGGVGDAMISVAAGKAALPWGVAFFRGIMCNALVCAAVWMGFAGRTVVDKMFTSIFPIFAFVACGFEHCVANMFLIPMGMITQASGFAYSGAADVSALTMMGLLSNISAVTLGNIVGGAVLIGLLYWAAYGRQKA